MKKLDAEMKKTDLLLYQMIPKKIADRLRSGEKAANLCEVCFFFSLSPRKGDIYRRVHISLSLCFSMANTKRKRLIH